MLETQKTQQVFTDGSLNPRSSSICFVVLDSINKYNKPKVLKTNFKEVDAKTTTEIEYLGVIFALEEHPLECTIFTDNERVWMELNDLITPLEFTKELYIKAKELIKKHNNKIRLISREDNVAGWILDRRLKKLHKKDFDKKNISKINQESSLRGYIRKKR